MDKISENCKEVIAIGLIGVLYTLKNYLPVWMKMLRLKLTRGNKARHDKTVVNE